MSLRFGNQRGRGVRTILIAGVAIAVAIPAANAKKKENLQLRSDYIARLQQQDAPTAPARTTGSLWSSSGALGDMSTDYKAHNLNDTIVIQVAVQTTAAQSGNVDSERSYAANSAITGLAGDINTKGLNPLFNANSSSTLKGQGSTSSNTAFQTNLTGVVIAVLPSGNMVVEAQREIYMNHQNETVIVRGVVRPGDIGPNNAVPSYALSNLEIEMKGKGIISDSTRPPNFLTKMIMWLFGF